LLPLDATNVVNHDSALAAIDDNEFSVWSPLQDGTWDMQTIPADYWMKKQCKALLFREAGTR